jgi:hypothetical protein
VTDEDALGFAFERAAGFCECIGGGCPSLTHRPGVNRCAAPLGSLATASFFTAARFADRTDPDNIYAVCTACAESPRRHGKRLLSAGASLALARDETDDGPA